MAERGRNKTKRKNRRTGKMTVPQPKPTKREYLEYHNRADTIGGHLDQVMNPGKIYRDPTLPRRHDDRVIPSLSEVIQATGRFAGDKIKGMRGMSAGGSLKTKGIDGIAKRGKTRAKRG